MTTLSPISFISWTIILEFIIYIQERVKSRVQDRGGFKLWIFWDKILIWAMFWGSKYKNEKTWILDFYDVM